MSEYDRFEEPGEREPGSIVHKNNKDGKVKWRTKNRVGTVSPTTFKMGTKMVTFVLWSLFLISVAIVAIMVFNIVKT